MKHLLRVQYRKRLSKELETVTGDFGSGIYHRFLNLADSKIMDAHVFFASDQVLIDSGYEKILPASTEPDPQHPFVDKAEWPAPQGRLPYNNLIFVFGSKRNVMHYYRDKDTEFCIANFHIGKRDAYFDEASYCIFSGDKVNNHTVLLNSPPQTWEDIEKEKLQIIFQQRLTFVMLTGMFQILGNIQSQPSMTPVTAGNRDIKSGVTGDRHKFYRINTTPTMGVSSGMTRDYQPRRNHQVRGHWRTYANGNRTWVRSHKRGDEGLGIITKDYILEAGE